jgi:hypothetical protein
MHNATATAKHTIAVLSQSYLQSVHGEAEWQENGPDWDVSPSKNRRTWGATDAARVWRSRPRCGYRPEHTPSTRELRTRRNLSPQAGKSSLACLVTKGQVLKVSQVSRHDLLL